MIALDLPCQGNTAALVCVDGIADASLGGLLRLVRCWQQASRGIRDFSGPRDLETEDSEKLSLFTRMTRGLDFESWPCRHTIRMTRNTLRFFRTCTTDQPRTPP